MGYVKASKGGLADAKTTANDLDVKIQSAIGHAGSFATAASSEASGWVEAYWKKHYDAPNEASYHHGSGNNAWFDQSGYDAAVAAAEQDQSL